MIDHNRIADASVKVKPGSDPKREPTAPTFDCAWIEPSVPGSLATLLSLPPGTHGWSLDQATRTLTLHGGPWDGRQLREVPEHWELVPEKEVSAH
jgi:hypothetical protein